MNLVCSECNFQQEGELDRPCTNMEQGCSGKLIAVKVITDIPHPTFGVEVTYGEYKFAFTADPLRKMSHVSVLAGDGSILMDRMVARDGANKGIDFHLAGIEVFALQAVKELLSSLGEKPLAG